MTNTEKPVAVIVEVMNDAIQAGIASGIVFVPAVIAALEVAGYAIVPVEPTEQMVRAGREPTIQGIWRAMVAARPR